MNVFLVTRPIQYINVLNLPFEIRNATLLLQNSFSTFNSIYDIATKDKKRWCKIIVFETNSSIFNWLLCNRRSIDSFTTYSDLGVRWYIILNMMKRKTKISVYEEGLATYSSHMLSKLKKGIYTILNKRIMSKVYIGAHHRVRNIFVYDIPLHNKLIPSASEKVQSFQSSLENLLNKENLQSMKYNKQDEYKGKNVYLYLTNWTINNEIYRHLPKEKDCIKLIKPHPKLIINKKFLSTFDDLIDAEFVAEIVISNLISVVKHLTVIHEGSTSMLHFVPNEKLSEICLNSDTSYSYTQIKEILVLNKKERL